MTPESTPTPVDENQATQPSKPSTDTKIDSKWLGEIDQTKVLDAKQLVPQKGLPTSVLDYVGNVLRLALGRREADTDDVAKADLKWCHAVATAMAADERMARFFVPGIDFSAAAETRSHFIADAPATEPTMSGSTPASASVPTSVPAAPAAPAPSGIDLAQLDSLRDALAQMAERVRSFGGEQSASAVGTPDPLVQQAAATVPPTGSTPGASTDSPNAATTSDLPPHTEGDDPDISEEEAAELEEALLQVMQDTLNRSGESGLDQMRQALYVQPESPERRTMLQAYERLRPRLVARPVPSSSSSFRSDIQVPQGPLSGGYAEVALSGSLVLSEHPADGQFALAYTQSQLVPTLRRLEAMRSITSVQIVDLVVHWFADEPVYAPDGRPRPTPEFISVVGQLASVLLAELESDPDFQASGEADVGTLTTLGNLVSWLGSAGSDAYDPEARPCALLATLLALQVVRGGLHTRSSRSQLGRVVSQVANNAAVWLSEASGHRSGEDRALGEWAQRINNLHALGCVGRMRQSDSGALPEGWLPLLQAIGMADVQASDAEAWGRGVMALRFMSNIPTAWRELGEVFASERADMPQPYGEKSVDARYRTAVMAALSASLRARFNSPQDADEISSALFNLGVDVLAMRDGQGISSAGAAVLRALSNGMGMVWVFQQGADVATMLKIFNGEDCAVNFSGCLADAAFRSEFSSDRKVQSLLKPLMESMISECQRQGLLPSVQRMLGSFKIIFGSGTTPQPAPRFVPNKVRQQCVELLAMLIARRAPGEDLAHLKEPESLSAALDNDHFPATCAALLRWGFGQLTSSRSDPPDAQFVQAVNWWGKVSLRMGSLSLAEDFSSFEPHIPFNLADWGITDDIALPPVSPGPNVVSNLLSNQEVMAVFFGVSPSRR